ncbi:ubiquinol-cytochrome c reductase iron-sulfur subunit [Spirosoma spitsbergense]|jgi:cytochrome b6-f complex iron-sulfur subunit|uniref:QcrA and Rieske domain-containing protein n=1 Tax=Spirosoma spitsbergense TaxID=431554 RepID=UPI00036D44DF|nr:Rieske (2Fe-2S) protein [Spirosoma spitsbergense]
MTNTTESMDRLAFLKELGLKGAALVAFYCGAGTLESCSKSDNITPAAALSSPITLDLTTAAYSKLTTVGNYAYTGNILVAHIKNGSYIAISKVCTHEGTTVQYVSSSDSIYCPNHGATFTTAGTVTSGPARQSLTQYKTTLGSDGKTLQISN